VEPGGTRPQARDQRGDAGPGQRQVERVRGALARGECGGPVGRQRAGGDRCPLVQRPGGQRQVVDDTKHFQDPEPVHPVVGERGGGERDQRCAARREQPREPQPRPPGPGRRAGDERRGDDGEEGGQGGGDGPVGQVAADAERGHRQRPQPALVEVVQQQQRRDGAENVGRVQQDHAAEDQRLEAGGPYAVGVPQPVLQRREGAAGGGGQHQGGGGGGGRGRGAGGGGGGDESRAEAARGAPPGARTPTPREGARPR